MGATSRLNVGSASAAERDWRAATTLEIASAHTAAAASLCIEVLLLKSEPHAEPGDARRQDVGDVSERRSRRKRRRQRGIRVQRIVDVEVERETTCAAERELLARTEVQDVHRGEMLRAERFERERDIVQLRDRRAAVGIDLPERIRALSKQAVPALQESGQIDVVREPVAAGHGRAP